MISIVRFLTMDNHFLILTDDDYFWDELIEAEVVQYYEVLGWTEVRMNNVLTCTPSHKSL